MSKTCPYYKHVSSTHEPCKSCEKLDCIIEEDEDEVIIDTFDINNLIEEKDG